MPGLLHHRFFARAKDRNGLARFFDKWGVILLWLILIFLFGDGVILKEGGGESLVCSQRPLLR